MYSKEAMEVIGCSWNTLRNYVKRGYIRYTRMPNGKRMYWDEDVYAMVGKRLPKKSDVVLYVRMNKSTTESRKKMLEQQRVAYDWAVARGIKIARVYEDWAPATGFSIKQRPGLHELVQDVIQKKVGSVIVETPDRLARIGFELLEELFKYYGVEILVINEVLEDPYYAAEQTEDLAELIAKAKEDRLGTPKQRVKKWAKKREDAAHPGKIVEDWDGAGPGVKVNEGVKSLKRRHMENLDWRPQVGPNENPNASEESLSDMM